MNEHFAEKIRVATLRDILREQKNVHAGEFLVDEMLNKLDHVKLTALLPSVRVVLEKHGIIHDHEGNYQLTNENFDLTSFLADLDVAMLFVDLSFPEVQFNTRFRELLDRNNVFFHRNH